MPRVNCPNCDSSVRFDDRHVGKRVKCPKCQQTLRLPTLFPQSEAEQQATEDNAPGRKGLLKKEIHPAIGYAGVGIVLGFLVGFFLASYVFSRKSDPIFYGIMAAGSLCGMIGGIAVGFDKVRQSR